MTLPASGAIALSDLRGEFGGSTPDTISEYYRGAGLVPNIAVNSGIPTSGAISLSNFYSGLGLLHQLDTTCSVADIGGGSVGFRVGVFGSISTATYTDGASTSRTVAAAIYAGGSSQFVFELSGNSVPNNDNTFYALEINGVWFERSAASYTAVAGSNTRWTWSSIGSTPWIANPNGFDVWCA